MTSVNAGKRSNMRWAKTDPTSVAVVPVPLLTESRRLSVTTRASSPTRPGRTAFAKRPTENAEKTVGKDGCGGAIDCLIAVSHANARASTERRLRPIAAATHCQVTAVNASCTRRQSGPRQMISDDRDREQRNDEQVTPALHATTST